MTFLELAEKRYSCKKFCDKKVESEKLNLILEAGRRAMTAKNAQPQHTYVVTSEKGLAAIDAVTPCRYGASTVLVVTYDKNNLYMYPGNKYNSGAEDVAIVATHMCLQAAEIDVDSCWLNFFDPDKLAELLELPENEVPVLCMDLGYASEDFKPLANHFSRKELSETVSYK